MPQGGDTSSVTAYAVPPSPRGEGFGSGWQGDRAASAERNGAKLEAAQGAGADALGVGGSFEQRQAENAADWETTEDFPVEESAEHGIINAGATGAYNEKNDPDGSKSDAHASRYYESVRNSRKEFIVNTISRNTGIGSEKVSKMFDHLFINEYDLDRGHVRFDADYYIAESVQRLRDGKNIQAHDLLLVHHEAMEYDLMNKEGLGYDEAHERTNRVYNYQTALKQWLKEQKRR